MDNSDDHTTSTASKASKLGNPVKKNLVAMETNVDFPLPINGAKIHQTNGNGHCKEAINGTINQEGTPASTISIAGIEPPDTASLTDSTKHVLSVSKRNSARQKMNEIPFWKYTEEDGSDDETNGDLTQMNGGGDGTMSPTKNENGHAPQFRKLSCKDVYPDREAETFDVSDDDSSDEEAEEPFPGPATDSIRTSPKTRRKQRQSTHSLLWTDEELHATTMHHLDVFRRSKQFCDLILQVGGREIHCHRVVIGGGSRFMYKELVQGEQDNKSLGRISLNQFQPNLLPDAVESLVEYMYTAKLIIPQGQLTSVYRASVKLRVERVMPVCRRHIINSVDVENCVETWRLASNVDDTDLLTLLNEYIEDNFEAITKSNEFLALPRIKMVAVASNNPTEASSLHILPRDAALSQLAISWVKGIVKTRGGRYMEDLTEQIQKISVEELTNTVSYTSSASSSATSSPGSNSQVHINNPLSATESKTSPQQRLSRTSSIDSLSSSNSEENSGCEKCKPDGQWTVIASTQTADHMIALCCLGDILSSLTLHLPTNGFSNIYTSNGSHSNCVSTSSSSTHSCASSVGSVSELSHLSHARCAAGVTALHGKIYAIGGYNQSECLDSAECYDVSTNRWTMLARMGERRARFTAAVLCGQIYAVGGSTGSRDQVSVERYDPVADKWFQAPPLPIRCSGAGVAVLKDCLFCVGGVQQSTGVAGIKLCHFFDPERQEWCGTAQLNTGRSFAGVAELNNFLYCVGGTDGWTSLTSMERFDGEKWVRAAQLNTPRRGAGLAKHNDMLYCVGGSDGGSFWPSVEQYSAETDCWSVVSAAMTVPRSNVGVVSLNGLLFAVGGYSGRHFLNSFETLDESGDEWTTHDTHVVAAAASCGNTTLVHSENVDVVSTSPDSPKEC